MVCELLCSIVYVDLTNCRSNNALILQNFSNIYFISKSLITYLFSCFILFMFVYTLLSRDMEWHKQNRRE